MQDLPGLIQQLRSSSALVEQQRAQADALFLSIGDGALATDERGIIQRANQVALDLLGFTECELVGQWYPNAVAAVDAQGHKVNAIDRPITEAFFSGQPTSAKTFYRKKDGLKLPVAVTVSPILLAGKPVGAIEVFRDISLELAIDKMKSEFIALASHQLRTPLSTISVYSHLLKDGYAGALSDQQMEYVVTTIGAASRMQSLIDALLNISRLESGRLGLKPQAVAVPDVLQGVLKELQPQLQEKRLQLTFKPPARLPSLATDCLMVQEILTNLVANAIQYTPAEGTITITARKKGSEIIVTVTDSGIGIPADKHDMLFSPFFRAKNALEYFEAGTGLGLYMVKLLVRTLGGRIWFTSREGRGSSFFVALPLTPPPEVVT